ncbi:hypothetical protein PFFVO_05944, partial [Plasmodium falciparum Vietnam Oak-Knoll (FVO)]
MARPGSAGTQDGADKYKNAKDAKHLLDLIGETIQKQAHDAALPYNNALHGTLSEARFEEKPKKQQTQGNPCQLEYKYHTNATNGKSYPCRTGKEERFSQVHGAECDEKKISGSNDNEGACAPYRRLNLCVRNLENISALDKINKDTLLADVCLAALHEGQSITQDYPKYQAQYASSVSPSQICTMLARSFADIGDIIRGKDLYRGNNGKDKLEENLKRIFQQIHKEVTSTSGKNKDALKTRYQNDTDNYFQLREDWWNANRKMVWYAITCGAGQIDKYFRNACSNNTTETDKKCRCAIGTVPTYFDYVPQFLRWFEEWAEDFCRKRKHKLENAIDKCRGKNGTERYCDLNGYDCEQTIRGKNKLVEGEDCHKCTVPCDNFVHWIDNQQKEFEKQKKKYENEISGKSRKKRSTGSKDYKGYDDEFYNILKGEYGSVENFLEKLSKEGICQKPPEVGNQKADAANFTKDNLEKTFSHTTYCQACPWCGVKRNGGGWKAKSDGECAKEKKTYKKKNITEIPVLTPDKEKHNILQKYENFCKNSDGNNGDQIKNWQCYYEEKDESDNDGDSNICVLQNENIGKKEEKSMPYHPFFWKWVTEMLIDSMYWRKELKRCINKETKACKNGCKNNCDCYKRWVEEKKKEWGQIKTHFNTQEDMREDIGENTDPGIILAALLNIEDLFENIKDTYGDVKEIKDINQMLEKENEENEGTAGADSKKKNTIDLMINHEQKDAQKCVTNNPDKDCKQPQSPLRSDTSHDGPQSPAPNHEEDLDEVHDNDIPHRELKIEGEEDIEPVFEVDPEEEAEDTAEDTTEDDNVEKVCNTVKNALTGDNNLNAACNLKYGYPQRHWGWKCISETTTSGGSGATTGGLCIPPRRRKLYVGKLEQWANSSGSDTAVGGGNTDALRDAFIKSAAVETFFAWHKYKAENTKKPDATMGALVGIPGGTPQSQLPGSDSDPSSPQNQLASGKIPPDFLRLMFYTLGDYRDICVGKTPHGIDTVSASDSGDNKSSKNPMQEISEKIKKTLNGDNNQKSGSSPSPSEKNSGKTPKDWWNQHGKHIWEGMICALTYNTNSGAKDTPPTQDPTVKSALLDTNKNTPKTEYQYNSVTLKEEDESGPKTDTIQPPTLKQFTSRPPYFRYLEEWGQNFCKERKKRLDQIYKECKVGEGARGGKKCSGYGEDCDDNLPEDPSNFPDFYCTSCSKPCGLYKRWITRKKDEYEKQKSAYTGQQGKCQTQSNGDESNKARNVFCGTPETTCDTAKEFLQKLGPCSKNDDESGKGNKKIFDDDAKTFGPADNCKPCSEFKINCKNGKCSNGDDINVGCNCKKNRNDYITASDIKNGCNSTHKLDMLVSDDNPNENKFDGLQACEHAGIFKGIRNDEWTCGNVCGYNVCKPKIVNREKGNGNQIIIIRALFKIWLEYFLQDYNKIRTKLKPCMNNNDASPCIKGCALEWLKKKKEEWDKIKKHYKTQNEGDDIKTFVSNILNALQPQTEVLKAIKPCKELRNFEDSIHCNGAVSSENGKPQKKDIVECLLDKLKKDAENCQNQPSGTPCTQSTSQQTLEEEDLLLEEENEQKVAQPKICGEMKEETKEQEEGDECKAVTPSEPGEKKKEEEKEDKDGDPAIPAPDTKPEEKVPPEPALPPAPPAVDHPQADQPTNSISDILSSTIPFGIAIALTSI